MNLTEGKWLINTDNWFIAPDGRQYRAVWGSVKILNDNEVFGIKTNRGSSNWFALVGNGKNQMIVAGCQIHYATKSDERPNTEDVPDYQADAASGLRTFSTPTKIWIAEED